MSKVQNFPQLTPYYSGVKFYTSELSVLCVIFQVWYIVFCSESIECFLGTFSKFFFELPLTIPVALIITGTIVHFRFHIRCISTYKLLYFNLFFLLHNISVCGLWRIHEFISDGGSMRLSLAKGTCICYL